MASHICIMNKLYFSVCSERCFFSLCLFFFGGGEECLLYIVNFLSSEENHLAMSFGLNSRFLSGNTFQTDCQEEGGTGLSFKWLKRPIFLNPAIQRTEGTQESPEP